MVHSRISQPRSEPTPDQSSCEPTGTVLIGSWPQHDWIFLASSALSAAANKSSNVPKPGQTTAPKLRVGPLWCGWLLRLQ
jgi:hypothetical protein